MNKNFMHFKTGKACVLLALCGYAGGAWAGTDPAGNPKGVSHLASTHAMVNVNAYVNWTISGKVTSSKGEPLPGVTVLLKGTTNGTATDVNGNYTLSVPERGGVLVFSFIGYTTLEKAFTGAGTVNATMADDAKALQEVVVVGYGTQQKSQVTGAISSVSAKEIAEQPITNAQQALQGRAAGVEVLSTGNRPGQGLNVRIRGRRSFNAGNEPLYVVDGIPLSGGINDINPNDIESMEILKDASSTAIYGSRGANGVVLITTKRGAAGKTIVSYDGYYGVSTPANGLIDMMNGEEFAEFKRESRRAAGKYNDLDPNADKNLFEAVELESIALGRSTNYQELISRTGAIQSHQVALSGGSDKTRFNVSLNHFNDKGITIGQDFTRNNVRVNIDNQVNSRFKFGVSMLASISNQNWGPNPWGGALSENPLGVPYDKDGNLLFRPTTDGLRTNPVSEIQPNAIIDENRRTRAFASMFGEYQIADGLTYRLNFGPDYQIRRNGTFLASKTNARSEGTPFASNTNNMTFAYTLENVLNYSKKFKDIHDLNVTGLFSIQKQRDEFYQIRVSGMPYEYQLFYKLSSAATIESVNSDLDERGLLSYMARVNYGLKDKYLLTLTTRVDGSSKFAGETNLFGDTKKYGFFPSIALGWRISEEPFLQGNPVINNLKLRTSYGMTGNEGIDPYMTQGGLARTTYAFGNTGAFGYRPSDLINPDLRWETTATGNIGLDYAVLNNRISGSLELYQQNTYDLLMPRNLAPTSGYQNILQNIGKSRNTGLEVNVSTVNVDHGGEGFKWSTDLNFFTNKEEIVEIYSGKKDDVGSRYFIGQPLTVYYDFQKIGIWQSNEADEALKYKQRPGEIKVKDQNNDGVINDLDRVILGSDVPQWSGGITNRFSFKGLDLSFFVFARQGSLIRSTFHDSYNSLFGRYNNLDVDYWTPANPNNPRNPNGNPTNAYPRPNFNQERPRYSSSMSYFDGSFLKVRNISMGYNIPQNLVEKAKLQSLRVYASAQNPFMFHHLGRGLDPEQGRGRSGGREQTNELSAGAPSTRIVLLGINAKF